MTAMSRRESPTLATLVAAHLSRRAFAAGAATAASAGALLRLGARAAEAASSTLGFKEVARGYDETHHVAEGYSAR
ncbi:MAG: dTDP-glucose 4,6-dehydratase, partial [Alphaproteobacteria bacterium]